MQPDPIVIAGYARTAIGAFRGVFDNLPAPALGAAAIRAAVERAGLGPEEVQEVYLGCVLSAGQGQAPARQAALGAGLPVSVPCTTVNKMCGSGMKAAMLAHDGILASAAGIVVAGGMESMSNAPYLLPKARGGYRLGHARVLDHLFLDGLEDAYEQGRLMGSFAEDCATHYRFSRQTQDRFATASLIRARQANEDGSFAREIAAIEVGETLVARDQTPFAVDPAKIPQLKPVFRENGTITPANASSISDGAAALVLMRASEAERRGLKPRAAIRAHATHAQAPNRFTTAPVGALNKLLDKLGWRTTDVDLYEINEAFAVVTLAAMQELDLSHDKVNVHGGACALGHPIGASGARITVTLLAALEKYDLKRGVAALCIGGGEATAIALERL